MSNAHSSTRTYADRVGTLVVTLVAVAVVLIAVAFIGHEVRIVLDTVTKALDGSAVAGWVGRYGR